MMAKKSNWPALLLVFSMAFMVAAYFWMFGSVFQESPHDEENTVNMHLGGSEKLAVFEVPQFVSDAPTKYKAILKIMTNQTLDIKLHSCCGSEWIMEGLELGLLQHDAQDFIPSNSDGSTGIQRFAFTPTREGREILDFKYHHGLEDRAVRSTAVLVIIAEPS
mmetsp:Transcript_17794/g.37536  ORF Transcript_17794/g.37536 Transcript_17794/m.37536 type:complete len:163 (-) Transcript_17794:53-541(-)